MPDGTSRRTVLAAMAGTAAGLWFPAAGYAARRRLKVDGSAALKAALGGARPGDEIVLGPGAYPDSYTIPASGTAGAPIVIRPSAEAGAVLTGRLGFAKHDFVWVFGLRLAGGGAFVINGDHNRVEGCQITSEGSITLTDGASHNRIGFNRFRGTTNDPDILIHLNRMQIGKKTAKGNRIFRNHFVAAPRHMSFPCIYVGETRITTYPDTDTIIEYNLFDRVKRKSCVRLKANGVTVRYNTVMCDLDKANDGLARLDNRNGRRNLFLANYMKNSNGMVIHDADNVCRGNVCDGPATCLSVMAGVTASTEDSSHPACLRGRFDGNVGRMRIGYEYYDAGTLLYAKDNLVLGHEPASAIKLYPYQRGTQILPSTWPGGPRARMLRKAEVGPEAWPGP